MLPQKNRKISVDCNRGRGTIVVYCLIFIKYGFPTLGQNELSHKIENSPTSSPPRAVKSNLDWKANSVRAKTTAAQIPTAIRTFTQTGILHVRQDQMEFEELFNNIIYFNQLTFHMVNFNAGNFPNYPAVCD
jgi:hypothetical protein